MLKEKEIPYNESYVIPGNFFRKSGYYGLSRLMSLDDRPEAVFAANDYMAIGAYQAARDLKIRIPEDVAITGFDDIFTGSAVVPRLTTVHVPILELAGLALNYLVKMIDGGVARDEPHSEELSTGLVIGESCGCRLNA